MAATCMSTRALLETAFARELKNVFLLGYACRSNVTSAPFRRNSFSVGCCPTVQARQIQTNIGHHHLRRCCTRHNHVHCRVSLHQPASSLSTFLSGGKTSGFPLCSVGSENAGQERLYSSSHEDAVRAAKSVTVDPYKLVEFEMASLASDIKKLLSTKEALLSTMAHHFFDGKGKSFRPLVAMLMSKACNAHNLNAESMLWSQKIVAMVVEMIHAASLVHDDVIDASDTRRGQPSLNKLYGQRRSILTGDYILSEASIAISKTGNTRVIMILSSILEDLVSGEFMQLGSKEDENERFSHYLKKTFRKTASLIANTCQSVAILAECDEHISEMAYQYGRNLGVAFQLVDDLLDFTSTTSTMGKPTAADLKLGLATAPVLFAAQQHPELHAMIMRRFSNEGDVEYARRLVEESNGVEQTRLLAHQHSKEAERSLQDFADSNSKRALILLANMLLQRKK
ncbi:decaprenyl-diphosphate synthase subunit 1 [Aplysia californica]|uniref:Decaprenyl-diphosphate synthase subunit 1 n=1 Tax=Aplysia californica TaxID=6500 RepID=A0ABM0K859_APLCA|nr:decaprenyl-diphosphate synthase subunit 1 [Aplysia californica]